MEEDHCKKACETVEPDLMFELGKSSADETAVAESIEECGNKCT